MERKEKEDRFSSKRPGQQEQRHIRLAALDMDGTLLREDGTLSPRNRRALICARNAGIHVVPASGRTLSAMPKEVLSLPGMEYAITANGAQVTELKTGKTLYWNGLSALALESVLPLLTGEGRVIEVFIQGKAYAPRDYVMDPAAFGVTKQQVEYVRKTRTPVEHILPLIRTGIDQVESINTIYRSEEQKERERQILSSCPGVSVTSSMAYNLEIVGETTSKADGLANLCELLGLSPDQTLACGDSGNDVEMLAFAGISVAMANAGSEVHKAAVFTTLSNDQDGVAAAFKRFILDPQGIFFPWEEEDYA